MSAVNKLMQTIFFRKRLNIRKNLSTNKSTGSTMEYQRYCATMNYIEVEGILSDIAFATLNEVREIWWPLMPTKQNKWTYRDTLVKDLDLEDTVVECLPFHS